MISGLSFDSTTNYTYYVALGQHQHQEEYFLSSFSEWIKIDLEEVYLIAIVLTFLLYFVFMVTLEIIV